jgi:hypothetical protein
VSFAGLRINGRPIEPNASIAERERCDHKRQTEIAVSDLRFDRRRQLRSITIAQLVENGGDQRVG